jgi:hypothetical protein
MSLIWTKGGAYRRIEYKNEADLEAAIQKVQKELFGSNRVYLDVKKKIGTKGGLRNIPDGYLLDFSGRKPRLYVIENELASHHLLKHIAVQILEFSLSFEAEPRTIKNILFSALQDQPDAKSKGESYASTHGFRNLDHLLDSLVHDGPFAALIIIDESSDELESALAQKFQFGIDVLELARYENDKGEQFYLFDPFLEDLSIGEAMRGDTAREFKAVDLSDVDTVVVPARDDGFEEVFIGENRWYKIRIHGTMRPQIKHIAVYRVAPISAITHIAPVKSIEPWKDSRKFVVNFSEPAREIGPIKLVKDGRVKQLYSLRYTTRAKLMSARTLDDIW